MFTAQAPRSPKPPSAAAAARRRKAIVRGSLAVGALLTVVHYISLQSRVHTCERADSLSCTHGGEIDSRPQTDLDSSGSGSGDTDGGRQRRIPHILHQSWKTEKVPVRFHAWQASWRKKHPTWEFRLWTDADNRRLLEEHYPWFLKTYDALPKPIMRADAIRSFYMHRYGGVYADLDMEALRNTEPLLGGTQPVLAFLGETWGLRHNIPNAWMASPPGHPFWKFCWSHTMLEFRPGVSEADYFNEGIERVTGPVALMECLESYNAATGRNVTVLQPGTIFAYDWHKVTWCRTPECIQRVQQCGANEPTFDPAACKAHYPDAYAITYWAHTWGANKTDEAPPQEQAPQAGAAPAAGTAGAASLAKAGTGPAADAVAASAAADASRRDTPTALQQDSQQSPVLL